MGYPLLLCLRSVSVWLVRFAPALSVVMVSAQRLVVVRLPELTAKAHRRDVVHYTSCVVTFSAQRIELQI